ncbi:MAG: glucose-6-phosphate isomerase [Peptoniphilaceae bacterium]|nr:glucose-6-phosphate isomerase [Peptoniphilaceae bacterium]MDY3738595.1 glucose-6-phosphate isomerase [Peptoniphilaceae bacterium]
MKFDFKNFNPDSLNDYEQKALDAFDTLTKKVGKGNDFLGWIDAPYNYDKEEFEKIKRCAKKIQSDSKYLVSIGIGGSYLGIKAVDSAMQPYFNFNPKTKLIYAGNQISGEYMNELLEFLKDKDYSINVISKSGTTTEPSIAFRFLREAIEEKYGKEEASKRIYATTDKEKGALKTLADKEGYETFVVPDDIGGRFSVISAVGLLPLAVAGFDIDEFMNGFKEAHDEFLKRDFKENPAIRYAATRNLLYNQGKKMEIFVSYEPKLKYISEWLKQLFAESQGKDGIGIFPLSVNNTTDLHSVGQMIQEGERNIFETVIDVENPIKDIEVKEDSENLDGLNFLSGKKMSYINKKAMEGTTIAHVDGGVLNFKVTLDRINEKEIAKLFYFFEVAVSVDGYMLGINPFDQPGVEKYKTQMYKLLGKPGY